MKHSETRIQYWPDVCECCCKDNWSAELRTTPNGTFNRIDARDATDKVVIATLYTLKLTVE